MERLRQFRRRYRQDPDFHLAVSLRTALCIHLLYALYKGTAAILLHSPWLAATACYYLSLSFARFFVLRQAGRTRSMRRDAVLFLVCGLFLLLATSAIGAVTFYTIRDGQAMVYPWHLIYGAAAYTFYNLTVTLWGLFRPRRATDFLSRAVRYLSLSVSMVSLFSLQAALLAAFGTGGNWERTMNILSGCVVFLLVGATALYMVVQGCRIRFKPSSSA